MTKEKYEAIIDEKLKAVKQELMAEYKEEKPSLDGWKVGDKYYVRENDRDIRTETIGCDMNGKIYNYDVFNITHGYAKRTAEEVQFQIERDAVLYELSKFAEPKDKEWNGNIRHYFIWWNYCKPDTVDISSNATFRHANFYFATEEDAKNAIRAVGEERIKKYYLGVDF